MHNMKKVIAAGLVLAGIMALSGTSFAEVRPKLPETFDRERHEMSRDKRPPLPPDNRHPRISRDRRPPEFDRDRQNQPKW